MTVMWERNDEKLDECVAKLIDSLNRQNWRESQMETNRLKNDKETGDG